jgi:hypothetical protein
MSLRFLHELGKDVADIPAVSVQLESLKDREPSNSLRFRLTVGHFVDTHFTVI